MNYMTYIFRESRHNLYKVYESLKKHSLSTTLSLITVKLMDYSDHLPCWLLAETRLRPYAFKSVDRFRFIKPEKFLGLKGLELSISYIASRGEKESHPHQTLIDCSGEKIRLLYYDYEGTVWKSAPLRAANFSVAEMNFSTAGEVLDSVYLRCKMPKALPLNRQQIYSVGNGILADLQKKILYKPKSVTFASLEQHTADLQLMACRFCNILPESLGELLVRAEQKIIRGIYREMIDQINLIADLCMQKDFKDFLNGSERKNFRAVLGNKQLSIRRSKGCNQ